MLWALLATVPAAFIVIPRLARNQRGQAGPMPGWTVPIARLEAAPRGRRRGPIALGEADGPLGAPASLGRFGLSTLGLVVVALVGLVAIALLVVAQSSR